MILIIRGIYVRIEVGENSDTKSLLKQTCSAPMQYNTV